MKKISKEDRHYNWCCNLCGECYAYKSDLLYHLENEDQVFTRPLKTIRVVE